MIKIVDIQAAKSLFLASLLLLSGCETLPLASGPQGTPHFALEEVNGRVLVTRGSVYFVASAEQELEVGDRVVSMENAEALLVFSQTDEQGEPIGEECQLRLPASAQITLESYADCTSEDAIVLNNVATESAEPTAVSEQSAPEIPQAETEQPQPLNSNLKGALKNTPEAAAVAKQELAVDQETLAGSITANDILRRAAYRIYIEPHLSDYPLVLQQGLSAQVDFRFGQTESFAPVDTLFSILPEQAEQGTLVFNIETEDGVARSIPFDVLVQSADQYIDVLAAPLVSHGS